MSVPARSSADDSGPNSPSRFPRTTPGTNIGGTSYILPIATDRFCADPELDEYVRQLGAVVDLIIVDGSPPDVFAFHAGRWREHARHIPVDPDLATPNGKVGGVLTGLRHARYEYVIIADDDVRYTLAELKRMMALLRDVHVVRPQNYFDPLPWHARWDTARTLLNRASGGDWPGTLGVRRSALLGTSGYNGSVLFENFELVRTIRAAGGTEAVPLDMYVRRVPPTARHFLGQRVRQAYDEFARPVRLTLYLSIVPALAVQSLRGGWRGPGFAALAVVGMAEVGRRRAGGTRVFPGACSLLAPFWVLERGACMWVALAWRVRYGGVRYRNVILRDAATPARRLGARLRSVRLPEPASLSTESSISIA